MDAIQQLFTPLDKDYCLLFYWLTVVNFIFLAVASLGFISSLVLLFRGKIHSKDRKTWESSSSTFDERNSQSCLSNHFKRSGTEPSSIEFT